jgi:succinate dehydrogenase / fumarate reductase iron-sulfur subunit
MNEAGFGHCTNTFDCVAACPKEIRAEFMAQLNRDYARALIRRRLRWES